MPVIYCYVTNDPPIHRGLKYQFYIVINVSAGQPGVSQSGPHCKQKLGRGVFHIILIHLRPVSQPGYVLMVIKEALEGKPNA